MVARGQDEKQVELRGRHDMLDVADAAYHTVHDYEGGSTSLAPRLDLTPDVLNNKVNPRTATHHLYLDQAVRLMEVTGDHRILRAQCHRLGYLDPIACINYAGIADEALLEIVARVHAESGDVSRALIKALSDGSVSPGEALDVREQIRQAMSALAELADRVDGMAQNSTSKA